MKLFDVVRGECVATGVTAADREAILRRIAALAKASDLLGSVEEGALYDALAAREDLGSTGFGDGVAIPHCRLPAVSEFVVGVVTVPEGCEFQALDGQPVKLFVFIIAPDDASNAHIRLLSAISQALTVPGAVAEILAAGTAEAARESFLRHAIDQSTEADPQSMNLLQVVIQEEALLREILQVLTGMDAVGVTVLPAETTGAYLAKMPLFAGFWSDEGKDYCQVVLAVVERRLSNEALRRIERVTGPLSDRRGVLVTVQELFYAAGSLD